MDVVSDDLLESLRDFDALRDQPEHEKPDRVFWEVQRRVDPQLGDASFIAQLSSPLQAALGHLGVSRLYRHQEEAIRAGLAGQDVVLEAPTASGKTLAYAVPMFQTLLEDPKSYALIIHPTKALTADQRHQIEKLSRGLPPSCRQLDSWPFDGDTDPGVKSAFKKSPPSIVLTNPEMLQYTFLGWRDQWHEFLRAVKYIVIDEMHEYRGYFGTNFAFLLRRFLAYLAQIGATPQLFLATATCANPEEHAASLTGRNPVAIRASSRMQPERRYAFISPEGIPDYQFTQIYYLRIASAGLACIKTGRNFICFCHSRKAAEEVFKLAKREARRRGVDPELVAPYKSGLTLEQKERIARGLHTGEIKGVFCTNALELGLDIGQLDVCILAGFPDNVMSAWQRIGRTGRTMESPAHVLFYAMNNSYDRFFAYNVKAFIDKPLDRLSLNTSNETLARKHLPFVLHELHPTALRISKQPLPETLRVMAEEALTKGKPASQKPQYMKLSLRGAADASFTLKLGESEIGTISRSQAFREAFIGAIYDHGGETYQVEAHGASEIFLTSAKPGMSCKPNFITTVWTESVFRGWQITDEIEVCHGELTVSEVFLGYRLLDESGAEVRCVQENNSQNRKAHAVWMQFNPAGLDPVQLRSLEQIVRIGCVFAIPCDRHDTATHSSWKSELCVYIYESFPGGIGIADKAYDGIRDLIEAGASIARACPCKDGCPRCLHPPRLKEENTLSKSAGLALAERVLELVRRPATHSYDRDSHMWLGATPPA